MDKSVFRKMASGRRASLFSSPEEKAAADSGIFKNFTDSGLLNNIRMVLTYVSYRDEADTFKIMEYLLASGKEVAVPRCRKHGQMDFFKIKSMSELKPSSLGIPEPDYDENFLVNDFSDTLCIVPGIAFDLRGNRTGYGGGYYDRFLSAEKDIITAGLCYHSLVYDAVPSEPHDMSVDHIITEKGLIKING